MPPTRRFASLERTRVEHLSRDRLEDSLTSKPFVAILDMGITLLPTGLRGKSTFVPCLTQQLGGGEEQHITVQKSSVFVMSGFPNAVPYLSPSNKHGLPTTAVQNTSGGKDGHVAGSNVTYSTTLSRNSSVFSKSSESDSAAGTEISLRYESPTGTSQFGKEASQFRMAQELPPPAHEPCKPKLPENVAVTHGFEEMISSTSDPVFCCKCGRNFTGGYRRGNLARHKRACYRKANPGNDESSALREFMDDPAHQYWTWCKEKQNWWHKDERTNCKIWAPIDFD